MSMYHISNDVYPKENRIFKGKELLLNGGSNGITIVPKLLKSNNSQGLQLRHTGNRRNRSLQIKKPTGIVPAGFCSPYEIRTRDSSVKGRRLNPLTNGPFF